MNNSDIIRSNKSFAVQAVSIENHCNLTVLSTVEGFYIGLKTNKQVNKKVPQTSSIEEMKELLLADSDMNRIEDIEDKNEILYKECLNFKSILNVFSKNEDKFLNHYISDGGLITLYVSIGSIYVADCIKINELEVIPDTRYKPNSSEYCFLDQPVLYKHNNSTKTVFLTNDGIIKFFSDITQ